MKNKKSYEENSTSTTEANQKIQEKFYSDETDDITHLGFFINSVDHDKRREEQSFLNDESQKN
ncbi:hypothetical protein [Alkalihalobacillus sp. BA299]|uniref:hypothetical protein n=1 Tax=Alkalihalobacillus sp. BA299 TaxID=2815938 RepID=UPI001ADBEFC6|nr:hypothetical protein [Alkalihalobacillus sp. BA299]